MAMLTRPIPSSGERLPVIGLGTWQTFDVGRDAGARGELREVLESFVRGGGKVVDSSPMYGTSEEVVGDLAGELELRPSLFVATKVWTSGRQSGIDQMNASMRKLRADPIDLMQVHNLLDVTTHLDTLRAWKAEGRVRYLGVTHYTASSYDAVAALLERELLDFVQIRIGHKQHEVGPLGRFVGHGRPPRAIDFVESRRVEHHQALLEQRMRQLHDRMAPGGDLDPSVRARPQALPAVWIDRETERQRLVGRDPLGLADARERPAQLGARFERERHHLPRGGLPPSGPSTCRPTSRRPERRAGWGARSSPRGFAATIPPSSPRWGCSRTWTARGSRTCSWSRRAPPGRAAS